MSTFNFSNSNDLIYTANYGGYDTADTFRMNGGLDSWVLLRMSSESSSWSWAAHTGVSSDRLPSNVCHRGNRSDNPHVIRAGGVTFAGVMELCRPGPMSVLYGAWLSQGVPNCT